MLLKTQKLSPESLRSYSLEELRELKKTIEEELGKLTTFSVSSLARQMLSENLRVVEKAINERMAGAQKEFAAAKPESDALERGKLAEELRLLIEVLRQSGDPDFRKFADTFEKNLNGDTQTIMHSILSAYSLITKDWPSAQELQRRLNGMPREVTEEEILGLIGEFRKAVLEREIANFLSEALSVHQAVAHIALTLNRALELRKAKGSPIETREEEEASAWNERADNLNQLYSKCMQSSGGERKKALLALEEAVSKAYGALILYAISTGKPPKEITNIALERLRKLKAALEANDGAAIRGLRGELKETYENEEIQKALTDELNRIHRST